MLRQAQAERLATQKDVLQYIGKRFRVKTSLPEWETDIGVSNFLMKYVCRRCVLISPCIVSYGYNAKDSML